MDSESESESESVLGLEYEPEYDRILSYDEIYDMAVKEVEHRKIEQNKDKDIIKIKVECKTKVTTAEFGINPKKPRLSINKQKSGFDGFRCLGCNNVFTASSNRSRHWSCVFKRGNEAEAACAKYYRQKHSSRNMTTTTDNDDDEF